MPHSRWKKPELTTYVANQRQIWNQWLVQAFFSTIVRHGQQLELPENWVLGKFWAEFWNLVEFLLNQSVFPKLLCSKNSIILPENWVLNKNLRVLLKICEFWQKFCLSFEILGVFGLLSFDENVEKKAWFNCNIIKELQLLPTSYFIHITLMVYS